MVIRFPAGARDVSHLEYVQAVSGMQAACYSVDDPDYLSR